VTLAEALHDAQARLRAAGIDDPGLEAELLLRHALGLGREALFAGLREPLPSAAGEAFEALLRRRLDHEPTAYIVGHREFYGLELACAPAALIPRPETELLVELALDWVKGRGQTAARLGGSRVKELVVVDVGTGNGAIAVALAVHVREAHLVAVDSSRPALALARRNGAAHAVADRVAFVQGELLAPFPRKGQFDVILANLPYVPTRLYEKLPPEIREHEPEAALHAGRRGTALIEALLASASARLRPGGLLLAEHAWNQGQRLREAARAAFPGAAVETKRDLAGRERMLAVQA